MRARLRLAAVSYRALTRLRRLSQAVFLALFLFLPARIFLEADPLAAVTTALSTRSLYQGLVWSLAVILPTIFLGRFVCERGQQLQLLGFPVERTCRSGRRTSSRPASSITATPVALSLAPITHPRHQVHCASTSSVTT